MFSAPGQLGQLRAYAQVLREVASDVLKGDFAVFGPARTIIAAQMARDRRSEKDETRRHYHQVAVRRAGDAFRAKDFAQVVELLTPHLALLTPAERAKLDYARRHLGRRP